jgi:hypothetical protein
VAKIDSFNYQYTLITRNADERRITGLVSCRDLSGTKGLAYSILHCGKAAIVDIYPYAPRVADLEGKEPIERVTNDDEGA